MAKTISRPADICKATWKKVSEILPEKDSGYIMISRSDGSMFCKVHSNSLIESVEKYGQNYLGRGFQFLYWIYLPE